MAQDLLSLNADPATRIDLTSASRDDLVNLGVLGRERAEDLIRYRETHGGIGSWEELESIPGFSRELIEAIRRCGGTLGDDDVPRG